MNGPDRRLVAIVCADVVGYSRLMGEDEEGTFARVQRLIQEIVLPLVERAPGRLVKTMGDGFLAEFSSAIKAVEFATGIQEAIRVSDPDLDLRIGVHVGDVIAKDGDLFGDGVNIAARLQEIAEPGTVFASRAVRDYARDRFTFEEVGERVLKNIVRPVRTFRVTGSAGATAKIVTVRPKRHWRTAIIAGLTLLFVGGLAGYQHYSVRTISIQHIRPAVAVLPFSNLSGDPSQEYLSDGITENILTALTRFSQLLVIARNSTFVFKGRPVNIGEVSRVLGVRYVVEGSVHRAGDHLRVTSQLIDARTGAHLWADRYDRPVTDLFAIQDEIAGTIAFRLGTTIRTVEAAAAARKPATDLTAYDLYLQGRSLRHTNRKEDALAAKVLFERALDREPDFSLALTELAFFYYREVALRWNPAEREQSLSKGLALVGKAIELDRTLSMAHLVMGDLLLRRHAHEEAVTWARRALELNPNDAENYAGLANILTFQNRAAEAIPLLQRAFALDPLHSPNYDMYMGRALLAKRRFKEALPYLKECARRAPDFWPCHQFLAATHGHLQQYREAEAALNDLRRYSPVRSVADFLATGDYLPGPDTEVIKEGLLAAGLPSKRPAG